MLKAIVLAGGFGTRLQHITKDIPKPMAPINDVPFLEFVLDYLIDSGITDITLAVSYKWELIKNYFNYEYRDAHISYKIEKAPLGTGGAILNSIDCNAESDYIIVNGDTFFPINILDMYEKFISSNSDLQIAVKYMDNTARYGRIEFDLDNTVNNFFEKGDNVSGYINGGVYILNKNVFSGFRYGEAFSFEDEILTKNLAINHTKVYCSEEYFIDIGIPADYERAKNEISK